jgi:mono/diheme cytochrome c family protein
VRGRLRTTLVTAATLLSLAACERDGQDIQSATPAAEADPDRGQELFRANCAVCHGPAAEGTPAGPPLVHEIYEPSHHGDEAFQRAVAEGVQPHHWNFGPMPPVDGLDRADVGDITAWVRQEQRAAGIE